MPISHIFGTGWPQRRDTRAGGRDQHLCFRCGHDLADDESYHRFRVCAQCGFHFHLTAWDWVDHLADPGSFKETSKRLMSLDPISFAAAGRTAYRRKIFEAQRRTGLSDAAIAGRCKVFGRPVVLAVIDFAFLGGSMGSVVGEKVATAFDLATRRRLPVVTVISSSGVRMQEGALALMQLAKTAAAAQRLRRSGLPHISVWANPTTGGVYASFANLSDFIIAEPEAIAGFGAMRVVEQATGTPLPREAHTAEAHLAHGLVDQVVERGRLKTLLASLLELLGSRFRLTRGKADGEPNYEPPAAVAWQQVQLARHERRPTALDYIGRMTSSFVEIHGDRVLGDDESVVAGIGQLGGEAVMIVGHERAHDEDSPRGWIRPEGFRKAQRAYATAGRLGLPIITLIDTPGTYPGLDAEERGLGPALAGCLATLSEVPVPTIACIIGEGGSEAAVAFALADHVLMMENAILSAISPEDAAAILYRDASRATDVAQALKMTAHDCRALGVVDHVVPEPPGGAHLDHDEASRLLKSAILRTLTEVQQAKPRKLLEARYRRYRSFGRYANPLSATIARQVDSLKGALQKGALELLARTRRAGGESTEGEIPDIP